MQRSAAGIPNDAGDFVVAVMHIPFDAQKRRNAHVTAAAEQHTKTILMNDVGISNEFSRSMTYAKHLNMNHRTMDSHMCA